MNSIDKIIFQKIVDAQVKASVDELIDIIGEIPNPDDIIEYLDVSSDYNITGNPGTSCVVNKAAIRIILQYIRYLRGENSDE